VHAVLIESEVNYFDRRAISVLLPDVLFVPPCIEDVPGRSEIRPVFISDPSGVPHIHEQFAELLGRFLSEADRKDFDSTLSGALL